MPGKSRGDGMLREEGLEELQQHRSWKNRVFYEICPNHTLGPALGLSL
jgi:hypothetical protein